VNQAIAALGLSALTLEARERLKALEPAYPSRDGFVLASDLSQRFDTRHFCIGFDQATGAVAHLRDRRGGRQWADEAYLLGLPRYQTFSQADYDRFVDQYLDTSYDWALADFAKPGMEGVAVESRWWQPVLTQLLHKVDATGHHFLLHMGAPDRHVAPYGCPQRFLLEVFLPVDRPVLRFTLQWFNKPSSRLPEALWFSFCPMVAEPHHWLMQKLGQWVSPLEVVAQGNRKLHAIERCLAYDDGECELNIESLDGPLVAPGEPSLLNFDDKQPMLARGMHFNLYNNIWGTNFPLWYNEDARFRFELSLHTAKELDGCPTAA
jgi:hypothetical protein